MSAKEITLYGFWASSATWRVRAALHYKQLNYKEVSVDIVKQDASYINYKKTKNPLGVVPAVMLPAHGERVFCESLPILELIDEMYPDTSKLLPTDAVDRHRVRQICEVVNSSMQPLQNLSTLRKLNLSQQKQDEYVSSMMVRGVAALDRLIDDDANFCIGESLTMADFFFVPQMRNVIDRFKVDVSQYPKVTKLYATLLQNEVFAATHPSKQPGAGVDPVAK